MHNQLVGALVLLCLSTKTTWAEAPRENVRLEGTIVDSRSRWGYGRTTIVTENQLRLEDGSQVAVHQLGGSVDGIGMTVSHAPALLAPGQQVVVHAKAALTQNKAPLFRLLSVESRSVGQLGTGPVANFVRETNSNNVPIFWKSQCAFISVATEGSSQIKGDVEFQVISEVLSSWHNNTLQCGSFEIIANGFKDAEIGLDGINLVKFRESKWCRPATLNDPEICHNPVAAGLTTIFYIDNEASPRNGEILDADIELNGVNFAMSVDEQTEGTASCHADLANTLTHEIGHLLGLNHTCRADDDPLMTSNGTTVPLCSGPNVTQEMIDATMYNFQACGETHKASLEPDDIAGVCAAYPPPRQSTICSPVAGPQTRARWCAIALPNARGNRDSTGVLLFAVPFLCGVIALRRRRQ